MKFEQWNKFQPGDWQKRNKRKRLHTKKLHTI